MKTTFRILIFICYFILGIIIAPFVGWVIFFCTLPGTWRALGKKGRKVSTPSVLPGVTAGFTHSAKSEDVKFDMKDVAIFYPNQWGTG